MTQSFNAIYAAPKNLTVDSNIPLLVDIHDGPEKLLTTGFHHRAVTFVELGYAVLMINYRGSVGNGDAILQSLLGNIAKVSLLRLIYRRAGLRFSLAISIFFDICGAKYLDFVFCWLFFSHFDIIFNLTRAPFTHF